ncbi:NAD(P)H-hydrate epimerase [Hydrogenivirga caldilitoris]|uniref:Bifunctional NAD(P)H-hydrate repair enzyme n=1 Tax=Hydrogenivirga caldilitoris TaxID=246264 RepID=A0A497XXS5_9AQUI|nr:NAD(P)H-hydrate dehydratase [Hydrogenivirga caldilitoris]RLJ71573.1 NAD(P)H-hydrate epimerase [Hydrogenivirga caldilitoris]
MKVVKAYEMAELDRITIEEIGIPSPVLMENAARGVVTALLERFPGVKRILVVAGKGNNGGDGIAVARMLQLKGIQADLYLPMGEPKGDGALQLDIFKRLGYKPLVKKPNYKNYELVVDALFGTGFEPPLRGDISKTVAEINSSGVPVVSVDIPSGLSADTGKVFEPCIKAALTVTFQFPKLCHILYPSAKLCGEVVVWDISIPEKFATKIYRELITPESLKLPRREVDTYKNREGHVLIVGGSAGKTGAVIMSALAATRTGSGLVTVGVPKGLNLIFESRLVEEMSLPLQGEDRLSIFGVDTILKIQDKFSALALGMGMGRYEEGQDIVIELLEKWEKPILLDADGINNLADSGELEILKKRKGVTILTPHIGEFSRLTGLSSEEIIHHQTDVAQEFSKRYRCYLVLKGARTVVSNPEGMTFISTRGTPAMAKGGVGDVLSGMLVSLIGKSLEPTEALRLGVYLHGVAGELAEERLHTESLRARDIIEEIPRAYKSIENFLKGADTINQDDRQG